MTESQQPDNGDINRAETFVWQPGDVEVEPEEPKPEAQK